MSTRALYTFRDFDGEEHHVYKHHDGYPTGAAEALANALPYAWKLPRYEADEFAAAFVAGNKGHYAQTEFKVLRELEELGRAAVFAPVNPDDPKRIANLIDRLNAAREYAGKGYNGGGIRLMKSGSFEDVAPHDLEYWYVITPVKAGHLLVTVHSVAHVGETEHYQNKHGGWNVRKVPKARQGWKINKIFSAPLKTGTSLMKAAEAWENRDQAEVA